VIAAFDGPAADPKIAVDKWGAWFSGYAPIDAGQGMLTTGLKSWCWIFQRRLFTAAQRREP